MSLLIPVTPPSHLFSISPNNKQLKIQHTSKKKMCQTPSSAGGLQPRPAPLNIFMSYLRAVCLHNGLWGVAVAGRCRQWSLRRKWCVSKCRQSYLESQDKAAFFSWHGPNHILWTYSSSSFKRKRIIRLNFPGSVNNVWRIEGDFIAHLFLHRMNPTLLISLSNQVYCWCFHKKTKEGKAKTLSLT